MNNRYINIEIMNIMKKQTITTLIIAIGFIISGCAVQQKPIVCPQDAMQCPDGSYVIRTGPNCEFAPCGSASSTIPRADGERCTEEARECPDGSYVTRTGPNCEFAPCGSDSRTNPMGGDRDEHGCIPSAGYSWCEAKQKCLRTWEENCETSSSPKHIMCTQEAKQCPDGTYVTRTGPNCEFAPCDCGKCPSITPPGPTFCTNGKVVDGGKDRCGCQQPPKCAVDEGNAVNGSPPE
jgi:hypothetical protein